jgi:hypothetical protein
MANTQTMTAKLETVAGGGTSFGFSVALTPPRRARVVRAALSHPRSEIDRCDRDTEACDELDSRFTTAATATIESSGNHFFLVFPALGTLGALSNQPRLLLDVELDVGASYWSSISRASTHSP